MLEDKETLIRRIAEPGAGGTHGREASKAQLEAMLATEVNQRLDQVSGRLSDLTTEIKATREAMSTSSAEMAALTSALVRWTRVSVVAIIIYTVLTGIMVWVQVAGRPTRNSMPSVSDSVPEKPGEPK